MHKKIKLSKSKTKYNASLSNESVEIPSKDNDTALNQNDPEINENSNSPKETSDTQIIDNINKENNYEDETKFKIITALAVFYDLNDPNKFLKDVGQLIRDDGVIFIEFTDMGSMLKFNMFDAICHEHLTYFTSKIFCYIANKNNLRVFDIKFNSINGGSTQYFLC